MFAFSQKVGAGLPLWLPKGAALRDRLEQFLKKAQKKAGYEQVVTPHIGQKELYVTSGHYAKYGADSFQPIETPKEDEEFLLKPMNCPHHCEIYNAEPRSYKDLPLRFSEFGTVYRYEQTGELHGLTRVRGFTQDDGHIFCTEEQVRERLPVALAHVQVLRIGGDGERRLAEPEVRGIHQRRRQPRPRGGEPSSPLGGPAMGGLTRRTGW